MDLLQGFSQRIEAQMTAARELPAPSGVDFERSMERFASRLQEFEILAARIMAEIIRPRMERLASFFPDTTISKSDDSFHCKSWFGSSGSSRVMAVLGLGIDHDARLERLEIVYELNVVPAFFAYDPHDKLVVDLIPARIEQPWRRAGGEQLDLQPIIAWVEDRLLHFVATYLRLQACSGPTEGETAVDPVCGMLIKKGDAKRLQEYKGHRYYFCSDQCSRVFVATPGQFAHVEVE